MESVVFTIWKYCRNYQKAVYPKMFDPYAPYEYLPFPYFPIFSLPFLGLATVPIQNSYVLWSVINLLVFVFYMLFFFWSVSQGRPFPWWIFIILILSAPFFNNIKFGQLNVWLGVFAGEFVRNLIKGKKFIAGLWLAGLLLKFQTLLLILPFLLLTKNYKTLFSFSLGALIVVIGSISLVGLEGALDFINILSGSASGNSAANVVRMANWRMVGEVFNQIFGTNLSNFMMILGAVFIVWLLVKQFQDFNMEGPENKLLGYFLLFFATTLITIHSHFEMNLLFYPFFLVALDRGWVTQRSFLTWFWVGFVVFVIQPIFSASTNYFFHTRLPLEFYLLTVAPLGLAMNLWIFYDLTVSIRQHKLSKSRLEKPVDIV